MHYFTDAETDACKRLVQLALAEDLGFAGDRTSKALIPEGQLGRAAFVARAPGVLAGWPVVEMVCNAVDPALRLLSAQRDGDALAAGTTVATVRGPMRSILAAERTALNFLQRLSGVATLTRKYADAVAGLPCKVLDTRKTTPGWRHLEKYAVRMGGGHNHRMALYDGILIKDNHLSAVAEAGAADPIAAAVRLAREAEPDLPVEVEVDSLVQFEAALACRPDIVLLDNMTPELLRQAVARRNAVAPEVQLEASGGVTLATLRTIAETGVDRVSVGALTHSAVALDVGLDDLS